MADVDGTLTGSDDLISPVAASATQELEKAGYTVGLVSGRTVYELDALALKLGLHGPIIAENGGVAMFRPGTKMLDMGYSREPALQALAALKKAFPGGIWGREDNAQRLIDIVFRAPGMAKEQLLVHLKGVKLLDSGFIMHLMQPGITKGQTLLNLLDKLETRALPDEVMVFGDSTTDISLFELFPNSVLVINPRLPEAEQQALKQAARYSSTLHFGDGFAEVASYLIEQRRRYKEAPKS
jgi:phosphoglycolate phosphatase